MDYRSPELLSQEGMTRSLTQFARDINRIPDSMIANLPATFVRCNFEQNTMVYSFSPKSWMKNPQGTIHGGIIATMIDTTMGALAFYMAGEKITPTITFKVDYVAPGLMDMPVYVGCKCTRCGGTMAYITGKAWQADEEKPFATADGVFFTAGPKVDFTRTLEAGKPTTS